MFPLHQGNELWLRFSSDNGQHRGSPPYLTMGDVPFDSDTSAVAAAGGVGRNSRMMIGEGGDPVDRKRRHREVEKQRRKEMTCLYSDLRSKLPKRLNKPSVSDLMNEARNYISHMQSKLRDLNLRRDELKRNRNSYTKNDTVVEVRSWEDGLQVVISRENGILASKAFKVLSEQEGLNVVSSVLTQANGKMILTIHCEADSIDCKFNIIQIKRRLEEEMDRRGRRI